MESEEKPKCEQPGYGKIINSEVTFQLNESLQLDKVKGRSVGTNGKVHDRCNVNPTLNTITCDVEFPDGKDREYAANVIAENLL